MQIIHPDIMRAIKRFDPNDPAHQTMKAPKRSLGRRVLARLLGRILPGRKKTEPRPREQP